MTAQASHRAGLSVGARVIARHSRDPKLSHDKWPKDAGVIVDDYGDSPAAEDLGRDWALTRRWAVMLDNGSMVFCDDDDLQPEG